MSAIEQSAAYAGALARLLLQADCDGRTVDEIEQPLLCEDGKTYSLRLWCEDGTDYSIGFVARRSRE